MLTGDSVAPGSFVSGIKEIVDSITKSPVILPDAKKAALAKIAANSPGAMAPGQYIDVVSGGIPSSAQAKFDLGKYVSGTMGLSNTPSWMPYAIGAGAILLLAALFKK